MSKTIFLLAVTTWVHLWNALPHALSQPHQYIPSPHGASLSNKPRTPVDPTIRGFGSFTPAGSGRHLRHPRTHIYIIRSLADSGPNTLRECIELSEPRTCIFEVGGVIRLARDLKIRSPYITIAGQTAPTPGITILRAGIKVETHDVLLQHLAIRPGDHPAGSTPRERDGVSVGSPPPRTAYNVVLDHLSVTWALDENISTAYATTHDVTISNSIIAEGLYRSIHPKGPHSKGLMIGDDSQRVTLLRNLLAFNEERNPYVKPGSSSEILNNVVYGWGPRGPWSLCNISNNDHSGKPLFLAFIGNTYVPGPSSFHAPPIFGKDVAPESQIFVSDNQWGSSPSKPHDPWSSTSLSRSIRRALASPIRSSNTQLLASDAAYEYVLRHAGSRPRYRSEVDLRILRETSSRTGGLKDCVTGCAHSTEGWPSTPTVRRPLRIPRSPFTDVNRDGYTNLENWLFKLARNIEPP